MKLKSIRCLKSGRLMAWVLTYAMIFTGISPAWSAEVCTTDDLADVPLELLVGTAKVPSLFMISLDNSDTMDYGVMTNEATDMKMFTIGGASYGYVLNCPNATGGAAVETVAAARNAWKSQYYLENKMYYNPTVTYEPWPTKADSNVNTPNSDPRGAGSSPYDLTMNWGGAGATIEYIDPAVAPPAPIYASPVNDGSRNDPDGAGAVSYWTQGNYVYPQVEPDNTWTAYYYSGGSTPGVNGSYYWTGTWTKNGLDPTKFYDVYARYPNPCDATQNIDFTVNYVIKDNAVILQGKPNFNQDTVTDAQWFLLNAVSTPCKFSSGIAVVEVKNSTAIVKSKTISCAASNSPRPIYMSHLKFVETAGIPYNLTRRHFYMTGPDTADDADANPDIYLIDLNSSDTAHFFKLIDANTNNIGDNGEYKLLEYANLPPDIQAIIPAPGAGAYTDQLQNFANWVTYHSRRMWSAVNAVATLVTETNNMLVGMQTSPPSAAQGKTAALWINTNFDGQNFNMTTEFLNILYNIPDCHSNRGFSEDLTDLGDFYEKVGGTIANNNDKSIYSDLGYATTSAAGSYPFFTEAYGGSCQQAYSLVITDGASPSTAMIKNYDGESGEYASIYDGGIFGDAYTKTAADGAMQYYERDLKPTLSNNVPVNYIDLANHQHMVTYGLSFGVEGPLRHANPDFNALCAGNPPANTCGCLSCPTWKSPAASDFNVLDDLWHATINSRGLFMYADNPQELINQLRLIKSDIERRVGAAAAVSTNAVQRQIGTMLFQGVYNSGDWYGDLLAKAVDVGTGAISSEVWSAADQLETKAFDTRKIFTSNGAAAMDFNTANAGSFGLTAAQVNYLLGDSENEFPDGVLRQRVYTDDNNVEHHFKLGDVAHSEPFYYDGVVYIGANDGALHAFNADTGVELFGYIPSVVQSNLWKIADPSFVDSHQFYVDATPHVFSAEAGVSPAYLACGLGKGGKGVFCLTVDDAKTVGVSKDDIFNWEYKNPADGNLGYVYGRAYVAQTTAGTVVIFGNGYASASHKAVLYVRSAADGSEVKTFDTGRIGSGAEGCNGLSSPALIDYNADGITDYVYAGDLDGNLWKFDLRGDSADWHTSYGGLTTGAGGNPLFSARDATNHVQPITSEPDAMKHCDVFRSGVIVIFGTGQYLGETDLTGQSAQQAIYGIYDWELDLIESEVDPSDKYLGTFQAGGVLSHVSLPSGAPAKLLAQTSLGDVDNYRQVSNNTINYYNPYLVSQVGQTHLGWYYLLPGSSERVVRDPLIRNGVVFAVANTISSTFCSGSGGGFLYALDACSGGRTYNPQFNINGDNVLDATDTVGFTDGQSPPSALYFDTTLFDPFALQDNLYINDTFGNIIREPIPPNPPGMRYWRIIE